MNPNLDDIISRYLDGELVPAEQAWLNAAMATSPGVAARVHHAVLAVRAARRTPTLHQPTPQVTRALFQQLADEGLHAPRVVAITPPPPLRRRIIAVRTASLAAAIALVAAVVIGDGAFHGQASRVGNLVAVIATAPSSRQHSRQHSATNSPPIFPQPITGKRNAEASGHTPILTSEQASITAEVTAAQQPNLAQLSQESASISNEGEGKNGATTLAEASKQQETAPPFQPEVARGQPAGERDAQPPRTSLSVTASSGVAYLIKGGGTTRQETAIKVTLAFNSGHAVSVVGGYSPGLRQVDDALEAASVFQPTTTSSTDATESVNTGGLQRSGKSTASAPIPETAEPWLGVGYNYSVAFHRDLDVAPGIVAGAGTTAWRVGAELPVRYHVAQNVALELVAAANYVRPYPDGNGFDFTDDANRYHYYNTPGQAAFTAVGVRLGVVVNMAGE